MPTTDQISSLLFKKELGRADSATERAFFLESASARKILLSQLFTEAVPTTNPLSHASGADAVDGVVKYKKELALTLVAGTTASFRNTSAINIIPDSYNPSYSYLLEKSDDNSNWSTVSFGAGDWIFDPNSGTLRFYDEVGMPSFNYLRISCFQYVGAQGVISSANMTIEESFDFNANSISNILRVIAIADGSAAPATEVSGDIYIIDDIASLHADWDGAATSNGDIVTFNGTTWELLEAPTDDTYVWDTSAESLIRFESGTWSIAGSLPGKGLTRTGATLELDVATDGGLEFIGSGDAQQVKVDVDDSSIEIDAGVGLQVKADGIDETHIKPLNAVDMNGQIVGNVAAGISSSDVATVGQVGSLVSHQQVPVDGILTDVTVAPNSANVPVPAFVDGTRYLVHSSTSGQTWEGTWGLTGDHSNQIIEYNGSAWVVAFAPTSTNAGSYVFNKNINGGVSASLDFKGLFYFDGSSWAAVADQVDNDTIEVASGIGLRIKAEGVDTNELAADAVTNVKILNGAVNVAKLDIDANLDMQTHRLTNLADPVNPTDACNKAYADSIAAGFDPKGSVKLVSNVSNLDWSTGGLAYTIDGVLADTAGWRILLNAQTNPKENGIYVVAAGAWSRSADMDGDPSNEVSGGNYFFCEAGTNYANSGWVLTGAGDKVVDNSTGDDLNFVQFSGAGQLDAGDGLSKDGNRIDVELAVNKGLQIDGSGFLSTVVDNTTIQVDASGFAVKADGITSTHISASAVGESELATDAVTNVKIASGAVDSNEIASGAIDLAHMSVNSIDSDQYVDGSIDIEHLGTSTLAYFTAGARHTQRPVHHTFNSDVSVASPGGVGFPSAQEGQRYLLLESVTGSYHSNWGTVLSGQPVKPHSIIECNASGDFEEVFVALSTDEGTKVYNQDAVTPAGDEGNYRFNGSNWDYVADKYDNTTIGLNASNQYEVINGSIDGNKLAADSVDQTHINLTGSLNLNGQVLTNAGQASNANDIPTFAQVKAIATGLDFLRDVLAVQTDNTVDPGTPTAGDRYLMLNVGVQGVDYHNSFGDLSSLSTPAEDNDVIEYNGSTWEVAFNANDVNTPEGALVWNQADNNWQQWDGSDWTKFGGLSGVTTGDGLSKFGDTINVDYVLNSGLQIVGAKLDAKVDSTSLELAATGIKVSDSGIDTLQLADLAVTTDKLAATSVTAAKLNSDIAGNGIEFTAGVLSVNLAANQGLTFNGSDLVVEADDSTIENATGGIRVKDAGIGAGKLAPASATAGALYMADGSSSSMIAVLPVDYETPTETPNDVITAFTLGATPIANTLKVYLNGIRQESGAGNDYTVSGTTVTFSAAPETGSKVRFDYFKSV